MIPNGVNNIFNGMITITQYRGIEYVLLKATALLPKVFFIKFKVQYTSINKIHMLKTYRSYLKAQ